MKWTGPLAAVAMAVATCVSPVASAQMLAPDAASDIAPAKPDPTWLVSAASDRHNDALPLSRMGQHDDQRHLSPRHGRNLAYIDDEVRVQRQGQAWGLALLARSQASLVASEETLELAQRVASGQTPSVDSHWQASARLRGFTGAGLELSHRQGLASGLTLSLSAQLLALGRWRERDIHGTVDFQALPKTYGFDLASAETNDRLLFPYQQDFSHRGAGLLTSVALHWQGEPWRLDAELRDGGWLRWRGIPRQDNSLVANRQSVDADGFVVYGPLLQGQNSQPNLTRRQPWRVHLAGSLAISPNQRLHASVEHWPDFGPLPEFGWAGKLGAVDLGLDWRLHERRLTARLAWQGLTLRVGADRWDRNARSQALSLAYTLPI